MGKSTTGRSRPEAIALGRLFSAAVIKELGQKERPSLIRRIAQEAQVQKILPAFETVSDLFEEAHNFLSRSLYRHEYIYKNVLARRILLGKHSLNTASMLTEFRVGSCKADVVILNGTSTVYEIKSERDGLTRLRPQLEAYHQVFEKVFVIAGENHVAALEAAIPEETGILILNRSLYVSEYRPAKSGFHLISPAVIFESLQRMEYLSILARNGISIGTHPNTSIHALAKKHFCSLTSEQAHSGMVQELKKTRTSIPLRNFVEAVPPSLKAMALSVSLRNSERERFLGALNHSADSMLSLK